MRTLLVITLLICWSQAEEFKVVSTEEFLALRKQCAEEHPLTEETAQKLRQWTFPDEEPVQKFLVCIGTKLGYFDANGVLVDNFAKYLAAKEYASEAEARTVVDQCVAEAKKDEGPFTGWVVPFQVCFINSKIGQTVKELVKAKKSQI